MSCGVQDLSNDLLREVLDHIESNPELTVSIDRRAYLSVESFRPPSPPPPPRAQDIGNFRLTCRRFAEIGIPYQFTRLATRFSPAGFERLEKICSSPHLARHTRKFSYLIPDFYVKGREQVSELVRRAHGDFHALDAAYFERKAASQHRIVATGEDLRVLTKAMQAFRALQHVQILRLQSEADRLLLDYLHEHDQAGEDGDEGQEQPFQQPLVDLRWTPACTRAAQTMGQALARARSSFSRFSGPMMSAQSALALVGTGRVPGSVVPALAEKLTCQELHLEDSGGTLQDGKLLELSGLFRHVFTAARHMQAVHIGFPTQRPAGVNLETVFNEVKWDKLRAVGVQSWRLHADEIIALARRHRRTLRGLRLRDVLLRAGSRWTDVLRMLRNDMELLEWVSLRRIDYADHFDVTHAGSIEVPDFAAHGSDSDEENDDDDDDGFHTHLGSDAASDDGIALPAEHNEDEAGDDASDWDAHSTGFSDADTDHGPGANELTLSPDSPPSSIPWCTCSRGGYPAAWADGDLGDDGQAVLYPQRKLWEKWVVGRCPEHNEQRPS